MNNSLFNVIAGFERNLFLQQIYKYNDSIMAYYRTNEIKKAVNDIFKKHGGMIFDIYSNQNRGKYLYEEILSSDNKEHYIPRENTMNIIGQENSNIFSKIREIVRRLKTYCISMEAKSPRWLLLYKRETLADYYSFAGVFWRVLCAINHCKPLVLNEELEKYGLPNATSFFEAYSYCDIYSDYMMWEKGVKTCNIKLKKKYSMRLYGDFFFIRDLNNAEKWFYKWKEQELNQTLIQQHEEMWMKINEYLRDIESKIRNEGHIVINWLDGIKYSELEHLPKIKEKMQDGIFFENMYTPALFTHPIIRAMFTKKKLLDDKIFNIDEKSLGEDSLLIKKLAEYDYEFNVKSYYMFKHPPIGDLRILDKFGGVPPISYLLFLCLCDLQSSSKKVVLNHCMNELHYEFISPRCPSPLFRFEYNDNNRKMKVRKQMNASFSYIDDLFSYYNRFFEHAKYTIWMSDHGLNRGEDNFSIEDYYHVFFSICGRDSEKKRIVEVESLDEFVNIMDMLLQGRMGDITDANVKGFSVLQREDPYSKALVGTENNMDQLLQQRGIVTRYDAYMRIVTGKEFYFRDKKEGVNLVHDDRYRDRIEKLRTLTGNAYIDIYNEERFARTKNFYADNGIERSKENTYI